MPDPPPSRSPQQPRQVDGRSLAWSLAILVLFALLLAAIRVLDWSIFIANSIPRAELVGASLGTAAYLTLGRVSQRSSRPSLALETLLIPLLAAAAFLAWEATTLVLCPGTFEATELPWASLHAEISFGDVSALNLNELLTLGVSFVLSLSFLLAIASEQSAVNRQQMLRRVTSASLLGAVVMVLVPMTGPALGVLPLPATAIGEFATQATAVPRTGFVSLAAGVAIAITWRQVWRWRYEATRPAATHVLFAFGTFVVLLEVLTGRYSLVAVVLAAALVTAVHVADGLLQQARFGRRARDTASAAPNTAHQSPAAARARSVLTVVFFFSGMAALVYQVVFAKGLALTFGSTSHASTIVLATYMGGLALGSWLGGRWAAKLSRPVIGYAVAELGIAGVCAIAPWTLRCARHLYVTVAQGADPSEPWLVTLQLGLGALVLVPPTWLMGLTLPLLTRQFLDEKTSLGGSAGVLYTANTLGAAVGASVTGYFVLPALGIANSLLLAVFTNVLVAGFALFAAQLGQRDARGADVGEDFTASLATTALHSAEPQSSAQQVLRAMPDNLDDSNRVARRVAWIATLQLTIGGFVTFGLETTFIHLLATVAGTSAYAFSLMLFAFLIGLSYGSSFGRKWLPARANLPVALLLCQLVLAVTLLLASQFWDYLPAYFAAFGRWPYTLTFASREFVRFVVCLVVMLPPAVCIGAQFPIAMEAVGIGWPDAKIQALGRVSALNTLGNIIGALVIGFIALPRLGSHRTLGLLTLMCLLLSAVAVLAIERPRRASWAALVAAVCFGLLLQPPEFDLTRLCSGGNVYFMPQYYGNIIDHAESLDGGLTAVALSRDAAGSPMKTLLTNGKFQGNDRRDNSGEMVAQSSFAIAPLLHTAQRDRALVIGFGTGTTARVLDEAGFGHVAVAELSGDIVSLADRHFSTINHQVIHRPNVQVHVTDGRNFLLLDRHRYDLVSIELSSIWFAGAANLYNDEFYALVEPRLNEGGVLQQWVQLHRLSHRDIMSILVTLRQRFPRVWLYFLGKQGVLIACKSDCLPNAENLRKLERSARLSPTLAIFGDGLNGVLRGRMLTPDGMDHLIADYLKETRQLQTDLVSTDDNLYLEYSTPKGNVREYDESIADNEDFLARYRARGPFEGTRLQLNALN